MSDDARSTEKIDEVLAGVDPDRRKFLRSLIVGSAYSVPVVSSFSMSGLTATPVTAQVTLS